MRRQDDGGEDRNGYGVPVEQAHIAAGSEIREKSHRERAVGIERNTPHQIARRRPEEDGQKRIGDDEDEIPEPLPHAVVDVAADFQ